MFLVELVAALLLPVVGLISSSPLFSKDLSFILPSVWRTRTQDIQPPPVRKTLPHHTSGGVFFSRDHPALPGVFPSVWKSSPRAQQIPHTPARKPHKTKAEVSFDQILRYIEVIDVERILTNDRIITKYLKCMLRQGVCPPEARDFRRAIPLILRHLCEDCTSRQKKALQQIFVYIRMKYPPEWERLIKLYDPKKEAQERLQRFIES